MIKSTKNQWEAVLAPQNAITKQFTLKKNNKSFCEIILPNTLPVGTPNIQGWHFCMPTGCVKKEKDGSMRISFPPTWETIRFLSPYTKGKQSQTIDFPIAYALSIMRKSYAI